MNNKSLKLLKILGYPLLYVVSQYVFLFIISAIFLLFNSNGNIQDYLKENVLILIFNILIIFLLIKKYSQYRKIKEDKINIKTIIRIMLLGIISSFALNIIILYLKNIFNIEIVKSFSIYLIISTGVIGPILEEYLFRGIIYNKLLEFNNEKKAALLSVIIFSLLHADIFSIFYAFVMGYILVILYQKYNTLKAPIIFHITINIFISIIMFLI